MGRWRASAHGRRPRTSATLLHRAGLQPRTIVEIGCGDGSLLVRAERDRAPSTASSCPTTPPRRRATRGVARRVEAFDGLNVPAADDEYDLAVLSHVIEHVPGPAPLLEEAARVART